MIKGNRFWHEYGEELINPFFPEHIQPNGIDLQLGSQLIDYNNQGHIDTKGRIPKGKTMDNMMNEGFVLKPHGFYLGTTHEKVKIPHGLVGRVEGRSSIGRLGVTVHVTAGFIDTGFDGHITLEIVNLSNNWIKIYPMQRICQLIMERCESSDELYNGKYQNQVLPEVSRINQDSG